MAISGFFFVTLLFGTGLRLMEYRRLCVKDQILMINKLQYMTVKKIVQPLCLKNRSHRSKHILKKDRSPIGYTRRFGYLGNSVCSREKISNHRPGMGPAIRISRLKIFRRSTVRCGKRHHLYKTVIQKAGQKSIRTANIYKHAGCHTFHHPFAAHLLQNAKNIRTVRQLPGYKNVRTVLFLRM